MQPGRDLDALIAEKVMGWKILTCEYEGHDVYFWAYPPGSKKPCRLQEYSTDIAAAWEVVEKLRALEPELAWGDENGCWHMTLWKGKNQGQIPGAKTAPHVICLAALKAVGVEV